MNKRTLTLNEIRAEYTEEKRKKDRESSLWLYLISRRISFHVTWIFLKLGISANQTTFLSVIVGFISCALLCLGNYGVKIAGVLLANVWLVLDCVDGNIARYNKSSSNFGEFIDALAGYIIFPFLFMSLGIGVFIDPSSATLLRYPERFLVFLSNNVFLVLGFWSAFACTLTRLISLRYKITLATNVNNDKLESTVSSGFSHIIWIVIKNFFGVAGFLMPLLLIAIIFRFLGLLSLVYALINTSALIFVVGKTAGGQSWDQHE